MTLTELVVSVGIGSVVMASIMTIFMTSNKAFVTTANYVALDQNSRSALDQMSRDIRKAKNLLSYTTNQLVFNYSGSTNLVYTFDPVARQLTQWKTGGQTNVLLSGCDSLTFSMFSNIPQAGGTWNNAASVSQAKCISVGWKCSRTILGKKVDTEDMQQAIIVIRNKPVS